MDAGRALAVEHQALYIVLRASGSSEVWDEALETVEEQALLVGRASGELWVVSTIGRVAGLETTLTRTGLLVGVGHPERVEDVRVSWVNAAHALASATPAVPAVRWEQLVQGGRSPFWIGSVLRPSPRPSSPGSMTMC